MEKRRSVIRIMVGFLCFSLVFFGIAAFLAVMAATEFSMEKDIHGYVLLEATVEDIRTYEETIQYKHKNQWRTGTATHYVADVRFEYEGETITGSVEGDPFAKKEDIVEDNPYIYKLYPTATNRAQYLAEHYPHSNIILWQSPNPSKNQNENNEYESYFTEHQIPYTIIMDSVSIASSLSSTRENIVISCKTGKNSYQKSIHKILNNRIKQNFIWIIPEEWMHSADINFENFSGLDIRFFTNYFVDSKDEKVQVFNYNFIERYHNIPTIETFAYQGYDVTNFFVRLICNDFNIPQNISPLSYEFQMRNVPGGGYENVKTRFIRMQDLNLQEIKE